jgi:outer membrane protein OmpA-like peptidoglycan-associated protein
VYTEDALMEVVPGDRNFDGHRLYLGLEYNFVNDPLIAYNPARTQRDLTLVDGISTLDLAVGYQPFRDLLFSIDAPFSMVHNETGDYTSGVGDMRIQLKYRLTGNDAPVSFALVPTVYAPTGDESLFLSNGSWGEGLSLVAERDFGIFRAAASAGYRHFTDAQFEDIDYRNQVPLSLSTLIPFSDQWGMNLEVAGALSAPLNHNNNPGEVYAGAHYQPARDVVLNAGFAVGSWGGGGSGDYRIVAGVKFSPTDLFKKPEPPKPAPKPVVAPAPKPKAAPRVFFTKKEIKITEEVKFETAKDVLTPSGQNLLDEVAKVIKENLRNFKKIRIEGHCDERGGDLYNLNLSRGRAAAVKEYLVGRGVPRNRLESEGYGKRRPKTVSPYLSKEQKWAINRRVEFKVLN